MTTMLRRVYFERRRKFRELVENHDLFYSYSDDHRVWLRGEESWSKINEASKEILPDDAADIWNEVMIRKFGGEEEAKDYLTTAERWLKVRGKNA